jgi:hypothetical protein
MRALLVLGNEGLSLPDQKSAAVAAEPAVNMFVRAAFLADVRIQIRVQPGVMVYMIIIARMFAHLDLPPLLSPVCLAHS